MAGRGLLGTAVLAVAVVAGAGQNQAQSRLDACGDPPVAGCALEYARETALQVSYAPDRDLHLRNIAHAQVRAGDFLAAIETADSIFFEPTAVRERVLAEVAIATAEKGDAEEAVRIATSIYPETHWQRKHLLRKVASALAATGQFDAAVDVARSAGDDTGNAVDLTRLDVVRALAAREEIDAVESRISGIENTEIRSEARGKLALALARRGDIDRAVTILRTPPLLDPEQRARALLEIAKQAELEQHLELVIGARDTVTELENIAADPPANAVRGRNLLPTKPGPRINRALLELRADIAVELTKGGDAARARMIFDRLKSELSAPDELAGTLHNPNYYNSLKQQLLTTIAVAEARSGFYEDAIGTARLSYSPGGTKAAIAVEIYRNGDVEQSHKLLEQSVAEQEAMLSNRKQYFPVLPSTFAAMLETGDEQKAVDLFRAQRESYYSSEREYPAINAAQIVAIQIILEQFEEAWQALRDVPFTTQTRNAMLNLATAQTRSGDGASARSHAVRMSDANERAALLVAIAMALLEDAG